MIAGRLQSPVCDRWAAAIALVCSLDECYRLGAIAGSAASVTRWRQAVGHAALGLGQQPVERPAGCERRWSNGTGHGSRPPPAASTSGGAAEFARATCHAPCRVAATIQRSCTEAEACTLRA